MRARFPLAAQRKSDVRAGLDAQGVTPPLPEESQEICFVPDDDYRAFLAARTPGGVEALPGPGPAILPDGTRVGGHRGLWRYTVGQRRGLGLSWREPLYVLRKDMDANALVVAPQAALLTREFSAGEPNVLVDPALWPEQVLVQARYRGRAFAARAELAGGTLLVRAASPCERPAPGQVVAVYDADGCVLAGAVAR
jgi:tRNA-specific 2-thiouridylase